MGYAEGSSQYFAFKEEAVANTEESGSGGQILRRVTGTLELAKPEVTSAEKRTDFQEVNVNHGTRSVNWSINGELYGGDYGPFIEALLRRDFDNPGTCTGAFTISGGVLSRGSGSFITDGVKVGDIRRLGSMTTTANLNRNIRVTSIASDGSTCNIVAVDGGAPIANDAGPNSSATFNMPGKITYVLSTGHTRKTFTIERHDLINVLSQIARGCKVGTVEISIQPNQPPTITISGQGIDRRNVLTGESPVLTSPTAAGTGPLMSAAIGDVRVAGSVVAAVTGLTITIDIGLSNQAVDFANTSPDIFLGRTVQVTGSMTLLKSGHTISNLFDQETEAEVSFLLAAPGLEPRAFFAGYMPRVKFNGDSEDDPDGPVIITAPFRALKKTTGTTNRQTVLQLQDSSL